MTDAPGLSKNNVSLSPSLSYGLGLKFLFPVIPLAKLHESFTAFATCFAAQLYNMWIISLSCFSVDFQF